MLMLSVVTYGLALNTRPIVLSTRASSVSMLGPALGKDLVKSSTALGYGRAAQDLTGVVVPTAPGLAQAKSPDTLATGVFVRCDEESCETIDRAPITAEDVEACQAAWSGAIQTISKTYLEGGDYIGAAGDAAGALYGYGHTNVLFKPTKAATDPFRPSPESAMSYFVGGDVVDNGLEEDAGFAINGGKGWSKVVFDNHQIDYLGNAAIAMGTYYFTCATTGEVSRVEYTFGYKRNEDGKARIFLHHSSVPYAPSGTVVRCDEESCETIELAPVTKSDVEACQAAWSGAIQTISKTYLDGGDYIDAAAGAAGELYGYGHTNVLFKPTKAADAPFRPSPECAMSYFVGGDAVEKGYDEDAGFAINGGKGWAKVVFDNHQVEYTGNIAIAMGTYYFTCATTGDETRVEYTFGYKRCDDGKPRIFLHHSSVPYAA